MKLEFKKSQIKYQLKLFSLFIDLVFIQKWWVHSNQNRTLLPKYRKKLKWFLVFLTKYQYSNRLKIFELIQKETTEQ